MSDILPPVLNPLDPPQTNILNNTSPELVSSFTNTLDEFVDNFSPKEQMKVLDKQEKLKKEDNKNQKEFLSKLKDKFDSIGNTITEATENSVKNVSSSFATTALGGFNLILDPIKQITGIDIVGNLSDSLSEFFSPSKLAPKRQNVLKEGDIGSVYLADQINETFGKDEKKKKDEGILSMFGGGLTGLLAGAAPLIGKLGLIGGIVWMVFDGIMGFFKADEWGVGKGAGIIGGIFGGLDSGLKGAFGNMGKFALLGAGIGSLAFPGVGTIVGGLIGAAIGFITGWIGGENIANAMQSIWDSPELSIGEKITKSVSQIPKMIMDKLLNWIDTGIDSLLGLMGIELTEEQQQGKADLFNAISTIFGSFLDDILLAPFKGLIDGVMENFKLDKIWGGEGTIGEKVGKTLVNLGEMIFGGIIGFFKGRIEGILNFLNTLIDKPTKEGKKANRNIVQTIFNFIFGIPKFLFGFLKDVWGGIRSSLSNIPFIGDIANVIGGIFEGVFGFIEGFMGGIQNFIDDPGGFVTDNILNPVGNFFSGIFNNASKFVGNVGNWFKETIWKPVEKFFGFISDGLTDFGDKIADFFAGIGDFFTFLGGNVIQFATDFDKTSERLVQFQETQQQIRELNRLRERDPVAYEKKRRELGYLGSDLPKFHNGGESTMDQLAIIRKDEEVLSPYQSKMYRENNGMGNSRELKSLLNEINKMSSSDSKGMSEMLMVLKELVDVTKKKDSSNNVMINNNDPTFNPDNYRFDNKVEVK